ncbi:Glu/Leu/Phe/Val dehydrogenase dimerization domain-containing protein [Nocardioides astragali]|uniref:Glu/Leu/Phe/Val dehydrogenase dimerization domain-containing protein n=1 Tax=Nocardioides astragali TaxID=1776736 RepID=A0ABW2NCE9_9ACTN|nr:Glu/Leu/Phe/Val dehydrogenase dimerization domain-containing protein [Nocardioides astragali]
MSIDKVIGEWDGQLSCSRYDEASGAFFTIALHSLRLGPAAGGTRAMQYVGHDTAVDDATRLAGAMTLKMAIAGLPMGGGKSVIALPAPRHVLTEGQWQRILEIHAENLRALNGSYWTGPDVGTASVDMDVLHAAGGYAFGRSEEAGGPGSSAPETAHGVHVAIHASIREAGFDDLSGRRVLVQGLGAVGYDVAARVAAEGAHVIATDVDPIRCERARTELDAEIVAPRDVLSTPSDVFVPCATGNVVDDAVAGTLPTQVVAGAANNLLARATAADALARRGVVLAPDFVANGGGAIHLVGREVLGWSADQVAAHVEGIEGTLKEVFDLARSERISTEHAARRLASERLRIHV